MAQIAGFDSTFIPAAPTQGLRQREDSPDSSRVTPPAEGDAQQPDRRQTAPEDSAAEVSGRIAFTAKFGPDESGSPLQLVRGADVEAAETLDLGALQTARRTQANRTELIRVQEAEQRRAESAEEQSQTQQLGASGQTDGGDPVGAPVGGAPVGSSESGNGGVASTQTQGAAAATNAATPAPQNNAAATTVAGAGQPNRPGGDEPAESRPGAVVDIQI